MTKIRRLIEGQELGLGLEFFYFILNSLPLTRDVTRARLYLDENNTRRKFQMNTLISNIVF